MKFSKVPLPIPNDGIENEVIETKPTPKKSLKVQMEHLEREKYLTENYKFRYNVVSDNVEYITLDNPKIVEFVPMTDYKYNSITREMKTANIDSSLKVLRELLISSFTPEYNPLEEYFTEIKNIQDYKVTVNKDTNECEIANGYIDYIGQYCAQIKTKQPEVTRNYIEKWLVASVAQVLSNDKLRAHNQFCLTFTGFQGKGKTTMLNVFCPKKLWKYLCITRINFESKDAQELLCNCFMINLDDSIPDFGHKTVNAVKNYISMGSVKLRRNYASTFGNYQRYANIVASTNNKEFLMDTTGNRRFLCIEILDINQKCVEKPYDFIDVDCIWRQALAMYEAGFRYWLNEDEMQKLNENNSQFEVITAEEEALLKFYYLIPDGTDNEIKQYLHSIGEYEHRIKHLTTTEITDKLGSNMQRIKISPHKIGSILTKYKTKRPARCKGKLHAWWVIPIE